MKIFTFSFLRQPINFSKFEYVYQVTGSSFKEINGTYYDSEIIYKDDLGTDNIIYTNGHYVLVKDTANGYWSIRDLTLRKHIFKSNNLSDDCSSCTWTNELGYSNITVNKISTSSPITQILLGNNQTSFNGYVYNDFNYKIDAMTSDGSQITYKVISGSLPSGLSLQPEEGVIFGAFENDSSNTVVIELSAGEVKTTISLQFNVTYEYIIDVQSNYQINGSIGDYVSIPLNASVSNGESPNIEICSGELPTGIELNNGMLVGTITEISTGTAKIELSYPGALTKYADINWTFENSFNNIPEMVIVGSNSELDGQYFLDE